MYHVDRERKLIDYLELLASCEQRFGPSGALLRFGRRLEVSCDIPDWMPAGRPRLCYGNAVKALFAAFGGRRDDIRYAEGYAISRNGIPFPIQHAWLTDGEGRVLDPTWTDHRDYLYYGITFETGFVLQMLEETDLEPGLLTNPPLMRRQFGSPERFAARIVSAMPTEMATPH